MKEENYIRMWNALRRIADYQQPEYIHRNASGYGLDESEAVEMAYENVIHEAKQAIKGIRKPKPKLK